MQTLDANIIQWLDSHSGSLTALATIILCLVTGLYVVVTYLLLREQRVQARETEISRELTEVNPGTGAKLRAKNLGPGLVIDVCLQAGPAHALPTKIQIDNLGPGFNLAAGDHLDWHIRWPSPPPHSDIWLTLSYFDRDRKFMHFDAFIIRLSPDGVGISAGWSGKLDAKGLRKLASTMVTWWRRPIFLIKHRRDALHDMFINPSIRTLLAQEIKEQLEKALTWESGYMESFGEL